MTVPGSSSRTSAFLHHGPLSHPFVSSFTPLTAVPTRTSSALTRLAVFNRPSRPAPRMCAPHPIPTGETPTVPSADRTTTPAPHRTPSITDDPHAFWTEQWYPIAFTHDVPPRKLFPFRLFDRPYVLFLDEATSLYVVMDDVCPHRAVPLSEGRLLRDDDTGATVLECAYHGWQFDCSGVCTDIPAGGPDLRIPAAANIRGLYATSATPANLIFFFPGDRLRADKVPIVQSDLLVGSGENDDGTKPHPGLLITRPFSRALPLPFELLVENLVDPVHVHFVHHGTSDGNRERFKRRPGTGQTLTHRDDARGELHTTGDRAMFKNKMVLRGGGTSLITMMTAPTLALHFVLHVVPTARDVSTVFAYRAVVLQPWDGTWRNLLLRTMMRMPRPRWIDHCRGNVLLDGDTGFLRSAENTLRSAEKTWRDAYTFANGSWDSTVKAWRVWFDRFGAGSMPFVRESDPLNDVAEMADREVNDRVRWHGKDCVSCSGALRGFRSTRFGAGVVAVVAAAVVVTASLIAAALVANGQPEVGKRVGRGALQAVGIVLIAVMVVVGCDRGVTALTYTDMSKRLRK